jgi:hypothetical protein
MPIGDVELRPEWVGAIGSASFWVAVGIVLALVALSCWMVCRSGSQRLARRLRPPAAPPREEAPEEDEMVSRR